MPIQRNPQRVSRRWSSPFRHAYALECSHRFAHTLCMGHGRFQYGSPPTSTLVVGHVSLGFALQRVTYGCDWLWTHCIETGFRLIQCSPRSSRSFPTLGGQSAHHRKANPQANERMTTNYEGRSRPDNRSALLSVNRQDMGQHASGPWVTPTC